VSKVSEHKPKPGMTCSLSPIKVHCRSKVLREVNPTNGGIQWPKLTKQRNLLSVYCVRNSGSIWIGTCLTTKTALRMRCITLYAHTSTTPIGGRLSTVLLTGNSAGNLLMGRSGGDSPLLLKYIAGPKSCVQLILTMEEIQCS